jgi:hypothetical protein
MIVGVEPIVVRELDGADVLAMPETKAFLKLLGVDVDSTPDKLTWFNMPRPVLQGEELPEEVREARGLLVTFPVRGNVRLNDIEQIALEGYATFSNQTTLTFLEAVGLEYKQEPIVNAYFWFSVDAKMWVRYELYQAPIGTPEVEEDADA